MTEHTGVSSSSSYLDILVRSGASSFNGDIQHWDISRVKSLKGCFWEATSFNGNVNSWVVTSLTDASAAFASASSFDREVCWEFKDKSVKLDRIFCDSPGRFNTSCSSTLMTGIAPCDDLSGKEEDGSTAGSSFETDVPKKPKNFFDRWQLSTAGGVIFLLVLVSALALFVALHFGLIRQSMCKARNIARSSDGNIFPASDGNTVTADWHTVGLNDDPFDEESIVQTDSVVF